MLILPAHYPWPYFIQDKVHVNVNTETTFFIQIILRIVKLIYAKILYFHNNMKLLFAFLIELTLWPQGGHNCRSLKHDFSSPTGIEPRVWRWKHQIITIRPQGLVTIWPWLLSASKKGISAKRWKVVKQVNCLLKNTCG